MSRRSLAIISLVGIILVGVIGWGFVTLNGDLRSSSLLGLGQQYKSAVLGVLGFANTEHPSCSTDSLAQFEVDGAGVPVCFEKSISISQAGSCDPVQVSQVVPAYVVPWDDLLQVKIAITRPNVSEIARLLDAFEQRGAGMDNVVGTKELSVADCGEYGLIYVRQHDFYFNR